MVEFETSKVVSFAWDKMKKNIWFFVVAMIIFFIASFLLYFIYFLVKTSNTIVYPLILFVVSFPIFLIGILKISLDAVDNNELKYSALFSGYAMYFRVLCVIIIYLVIVIFGLILFIIPGLIWAAKFQFAPFLIIDKKMGIIESLKESSAITKGSIEPLLNLDVTIYSIIILGSLALGVGSLFTYPTGMIASAYTYRILSGSLQNNTETQSPASTPVPTPPQTNVPSPITQVPVNPGVAQAPGVEPASQNHSEENGNITINKVE